LPRRAPHPQSACIPPAPDAVPLLPEATNGDGQPQSLLQLSAAVSSCTSLPRTRATVLSPLQALNTIVSKPEIALVGAMQAAPTPAAPLPRVWPAAIDAAWQALSACCLFDWS